MVMQLEWLTVIYSTITIFLIIHQHPNNYNGISIIILVHGTVHFSTFFLDIGGMQIARQMSLSETPSALSENSEFNILRSTNFLWNFPIFQQPISIKPMVFPMMFDVCLHPALIYRKTSIKNTFYWRNLSIFKLISTLKSLINISTKILENISTRCFVSGVFPEICVIFVVSSKSILINVCKCILSKSFQP
jgi:hypothetical protein